MQALFVQEILPEQHMVKILVIGKHGLEASALIAFPGKLSTPTAF